MKVSNIFVTSDYIIFWSLNDQIIYDKHKIENKQEIDTLLNNNINNIEIEEKNGKYYITDVNIKKPQESFVIIMHILIYIWRLFRLLWPYNNTSLSSGGIIKLNDYQLYLIGYHRQYNAYCWDAIDITSGQRGVFRNYQDSFFYMIPLVAYIYIFLLHFRSLFTSCIKPPISLNWNLTLNIDSYAEIILKHKDLTPILQDVKTLFYNENDAKLRQIQKQLLLMPSTNSIFDNNLNNFNNINYNNSNNLNNYNLNNNYSNLSDNINNLNNNYSSLNNVNNLPTELPDVNYTDIPKKRKKHKSK